MGGLVVTNKMLDRYFGFLKDLDRKAKKVIISRLTKSIKEDPKENLDLNGLFGAWEDSLDSDEIISEIRASRVEKNNTENLG